MKITPRIGAALEAWTQVAGVFVVGYHPFSADSWSSLDNLKISDTPESAPESGEQCSLIAQLYSFGSGDSCDLTEEPAETESTPALEARSFAPQAAHNSYPRLNARPAASSRPAPVAEAVTVKAEDDVIVKVSAELPALAMRYVRSLNPRAIPAPKPGKMKRADRDAFRMEVNKIMREARFEKTAAANMGFDLQTGDKEDRIECDVDQVAVPVRGLEALERARRVRVIELGDTHEL